MRALATRLGQISDLTSGFTSGFAKQIVNEAEPAVRRIVRDERNKIAEALIGGIPFAGAAAIGYTATRYLAPGNRPGLKAVGYIGSAAAAGIGAWWTFMRLTEKPETGAAPAGATPQIVNQTATAIVNDAEPKVRKIVDDEKAIIAKALQLGIPWAAVSSLVFLATMFLPSPKQTLVKVGGYTASIALLGAGAWQVLDATQERA